MDTLTREETVTTPDDSLRFLDGSGEMACLMRAKDWSQTLLGPPGSWPQALRVAVRLLLTSGHPMYIWWGPQGACLYNDAYRQSIGPERHPSSLGQPARQVWAEIWDIIGPQIELVMAGRGATWHENALVPITRHGRREDVYWTYSYSPIDDEDAPNGVGGVLVVCTETTKSIQAAQALAVEQQRLLQLLKMMPGFVCVLRGPEHVYEYVNDAYLSLSGPREILGRTVREVFPDLAGQPFFDLLDHVYATGERFVHRAMPIRFGGVEHERFIDLLYEPIRNAQAAISGIFVGGYDVTEARRAEGALAAREEQLRLATDAGEIGFWDVDEVNGKLHWPARVKAMFGISPDVPVSMAHFYAGLHPDDRVRVSAAYAAAADPARRSTYDVEYRTVGREDGALRWVAAKGRGVFDSEGGCLRVIGTAIDITSRKRHELKLSFLAELQLELGRHLQPAAVARVAADRLVAHLDAAHCVVVDIEPDERRATVVYDARAPGLADLAGVYSLDEFHTASERAQLESGQPVIISDVGAPHRDTATAAAFRALGVQSLVTVPYLISGQWRCALSAQRATPHEWQSDEIELLADVAARLYPQMAHGRSEEQLRVSEAALREANRRKDEFLATLSHELRNPLAPILNATRLLASPKLPLEERSKLQSMIDRQASHMSRLLDDLLDVARVTQGKLTLKRARVPLSDVVDTAIEAARPLIDQKQHELSVRLPPEPICVVVDPVRFSQVITNLLTNAAKYTDANGRIEIEASVADGELAVRVRDTGIGLTEEAQSRIFKMFSQVPDAVGRSEGGLGIGLALVRGLVALHGGTVAAESPGLGHGSTFVVRVPRVVTSGVAQPNSPSSPRSATPGLRLLIADDNRDAADTLAAIARLSGHEVRVAYTGREALAIAAAHRPELALLDIGMPELSGYEVAQALRREPWGRDIYLIALTGWGQEEDKARAAQAGFDRHLTKPIDPERLDELAVLAPRPRAH